MLRQSTGLHVRHADGLLSIALESLFVKGSSKRGGLPSGLSGMAPGVGVTLLVFVLYLRTLAPTALPRDFYDLTDAGMFQIRAYILGIPNPTGYPTYMMLARLFTFLPFGDVGYRVNLASAVYAAVAVFLVYAVCRRLTGRVLPAMTAALLFGVSQAFWSQAVIAEVYTLNVLFISLVLLVLLIWRDERRDRYLLLAAFLMGLALTHHLTSGLLIPAGILFVLLVDRRKLLDWRLLLKGAGLFLLGLTPYIYLPIRGSLNLPLDYYHPDTPGRFLSYVTGRAFDDKMLVYGPSRLPGRLASYAGDLLRQFNPAFLVFAWVGIVALFVKDRAVCLLLGFLYLGWLFQALEYGIVDVWVYFIPTYLVLAVFVAAGLREVFELVRGAPRLLSSSRMRVLAAGLAVVVLLVPLWRATTITYAEVDMSGYYLAVKKMNAVAREAPRGTTFVTNDSSLWYLTLVEKRRTDLNLVNPLANPADWQDSPGAWLKTVNKYLAKGRVYVVFAGGISPGYVAPYQQAGYKLVSKGGGTFFEVVK